MKNSIVKTILNIVTLVNIILVELIRNYNKCSGNKHNNSKDDFGSGINSICHLFSHRGESN